MNAVACIETLEISGDRDFVECIERSLALLQARAHESYALVLANIRRINESPFSNMHPEWEPPTLLLSRASALPSLTWCASILAHEAFHGSLYQDHLEKYGKPVPYEVFGGEKIELLCIQYQLAVARAIEAPENEIQHLLSQDGRHIHRSDIYDW